MTIITELSACLLVVLRTNINLLNKDTAGGYRVMCITEAFEAYRADVIVFRNQSFKTEEHHLITLKSLIRFCGDVPIEDLTFEIIRDWKISMEKLNRTPETIRGYLVRLRVVLNYLKLSGIDCVDPLRIQLPRREARTPEVITATDVQLLIDSTKVLRNKAIISLLYSSGLRVSELCSLDRGDVLEDYFTVYGKGNKSRLCFIDKRSRKLINKYVKLRKDNNAALFTGKYDSHRVTPGNIQEIFRIARKNAGFDYPIHPHTLRHSFATNLMQNGCHIYTLQRLMGHSNLQTTSVYLHLFDGELKEAHEKFHSV